MAIPKLHVVRIALALALASCLLAPGRAAAEDADEVVVTIMSGAVGNELELMEKAGRMFTEEHPGVTVRVIDSPQAATDRLGLYLQFLEAQSAEVDIYQIDVVWPGDLAEHLVDLKKHGGDAMAGQHFAEVIENNTVDGRLVAAPLFIDAGLLYYRTDLLDKYGLKPPRTWDELEQAAARIMDGERAAGKPDFQGFVFQGEAYEGLTCNGLEWIYSNGGGNIVSEDGAVTLYNPKAAAMLERAAGWVGTIAPRGVTGMKEEESRAVFQSGNAAFMRNWPYAWRLGNAGDSVIEGRFDVSPLPSGEKGPAATLGGQQLAVSRYSRNPEIAADVALFMASVRAQKLRATEGSFNPTIKSLYEDEEVLRLNPFMDKLRPVFENAVARPAGVTAPHYNEVSQQFFKAVYSVLTGELDARTALQEASLELQDMLDMPEGMPAE